jgi:hypothetical protein
MSVSNFFGVTKSTFHPTDGSVDAGTGRGEKELNLNDEVAHVDRAGGVETITNIVRSYVKARKEGQTLSVEERRKLRAQILRAMLADATAGGLDGDPAVLWSTVNALFMLDDPYVPGTVELFARSGDLRKSNDRWSKTLEDIRRMREDAGLTSSATAAPSIKPFDARVGVTKADVMMREVLAHGTPVASNQHGLDERTNRFVTAVEIDSRILRNGTAAPVSLTKALEGELRKSLEHPLIVG